MKRVTPTIEEIIDYFKDADLVESVYGSKFNHKGHVRTSSFPGSFYDKDGNCYYSTFMGKYAKILTTKKTKP